MEAPTNALLSITQVEARVSLKKTEIYNRIRAGKFPHQVPIGDGEEGYGRVAWLERDIEAWIAERVAARDRGVELRREHAKNALNQRADRVKKKKRAA